MAFSVILITSCSNDNNDMTPDIGNVLDIESNDASSNSIIAYNIKKDGTLESLSGSPFMTAGKGVANLSRF